MKKELNKILLHESIHLREKHTIDIILSEIFQIFMWFNPLIYFLKKMLQENHEFYVDKEITSDKKIYTSYIELLARQSEGAKFGFVNQFNNSLILKRLVMLKKDHTKKTFKLKYIFVLPVLLLLFFTFSCNKENEIQKPENNEKEPIFENTEIVEVTKNETIKPVIKSEVENNEESENYLVAQKNPEFPGGEQTLRQLIADKMKYPKEAMEKSISGTVYLRFLIEKTGKVSIVEIQKGVHELLDNEAIRVIKELPYFIPGEQDGKKVNVWFSIPVAFKLK